MIILIQDRKDNYHLADYQTATSKYTACGLVYSKKEIINTLSLSAPIYLTCKKCYTAFKRSISYMHENHLRKHYDKLDSRLMRRYNDIQNGAFDIKMEFLGVFDRCWWNKLNVYKRMLSKRKNDIKYK